MKACCRDVVGQACGDNQVSVLSKPTTDSLDGTNNISCIAVDNDVCLTNDSGVNDFHGDVLHSRSHNTHAHIQPAK